MNIDWGSVSSWIAVAFSVVSVFISLYVLSLTKWSIAVDHERRKNELTVKTVIDFDKIITDGYDKFCEIENLKSQDPQNYEKLLESNKRLFNDCLTAIEAIAVGVKFGVYNEELVLSLTGTYYIQVFRKMESYVNKRRKDDSHELLYSDTQQFVQLLKKLEADSSIHRIQTRKISKPLLRQKW
jgi:hypothetical protein